MNFFKKIFSKNDDEISNEENKLEDIKSIKVEKIKKNDEIIVETKIDTKDDITLLKEENIEVSTPRERKIKVRKNFIPKKNKNINEEMLNDLFGVEHHEVEIGKIYSCEILSIIDGDYVVSIDGCFVEGILQSDQVSETVNIGDRVEAVLYRIYDNTNFLSVTKSENYKLVDKYLEVYKNNEIVEGIVKKFEDNNFVVEIENGFNALVFIKNIDTKFVSNPELYLNNKYEFYIRKLLRNKKYKFELSRRDLLIEKEKELVSSLKVGDIISPQNLEKNKAGLTFEFNEINGFIPVSLISHQYISDYNEFDINTLENKNIEIMEIKKDKAGYKIIGSFKALEKKPWDLFIEKYSIGDKIEGKVQNVKDYGIFIELIPGCRGLLHKNDMSVELIDIYKKIELGSSVKVEIADIDLEKNNIRLISEIINNEEKTDLH